MFKSFPMKQLDLCPHPLLFPMRQPFCCPTHLPQHCFQWNDSAFAPPQVVSNEMFPLLPCSPSITLHHIISNETTHLLPAHHPPCHFHKWLHYWVVSLETTQCLPPPTIVSNKKTLLLPCPPSTTLFPMKQLGICPIQCCFWWNNTLVTLPILHKLHGQQKDQERQWQNSHMPTVLFFGFMYWPCPGCFQWNNSPFTPPSLLHVVSNKTTLLLFLASFQMKRQPTTLLPRHFQQNDIVLSHFVY